MMTLNEAIAHLEKELSDKNHDWGCEECRQDHEQLLVWLKENAELKSLLLETQPILKRAIFVNYNDANAADNLLDKITKFAEDINVPTKYATDNTDEKIALEPEYEGDGYDDNGEIIYDTAYCPVCRNQYEIDYDTHDNYCCNCGQKLDWCRVETGGGR